MILYKSVYSQYKDMRGLNLAGNVENCYKNSNLVFFSLLISFLIDWPAMFLFDDRLSRFDKLND